MGGVWHFMEQWYSALCLIRFIYYFFFLLFFFVNCGISNGVLLDRRLGCFN